MKLYLAGLFTNGFGNSRYADRLTPAEEAGRAGVKYYLESYHYIHQQKYVEDIRREGRKVFLDSGAFSAFTKGVRVDLPKYCRYIQQNIDIIECASVLDAIGDAQGTYENQCAMERLGVAPLPCFHYGEDERYLEYYVANYEYITLGGMVPISTPQLKHWLDRLWEKYLTDGAGRPRLRVHGFGLTVINLMERYPWYSVDSSSWVQIAANGNILIPDFGALAVSTNSPARKQYNRHFDTIPEPQRQAIVQMLQEKGFEIDRVKEEYLARWAYNCWAFTHINETLLDGKSDIYQAMQPELFDD